ncbi:uncharacterized protein ACHE_50067S [Aspergillus chevalieri]|uniref:Uncharacterized protein n=1 Tax=Aspergillus chevalieri TaxID=182096 RepID=A0A7R7VRQ8_ASPCH|nr:uncharacterized protein ACHE_50067S [Aspergillus chevalieri]BCR88869.1 hypothetical protein ACHE_50067S [Aspergillus chevalieri]
MPNILITGSARGLGLEMVKRRIVAQSNGRVVFIPLEVTDEASVSQSVKETQSILGQSSLDILVNCAGVMSASDGKVAEMDNLEWHMSVNVTGVHNVIRAYLPLMQSGQVKKVINISSALGSITRAPQMTFATAPAYKISKAALNALTVQYALSYQDEGFTFIALCPGWVQTDMGSEKAHLTVDQGVRGIMEVINSVEQKDNGTFKNTYQPGWDIYDGKGIPF